MARLHVSSATVVISADEIAAIVEGYSDILPDGLPALIRQWADNVAGQELAFQLNQDPIPKG